MKILLFLLLPKRAAGLFGLEVDCGGAVKSDFCVSCPPSASGCGGECDWVAERSLCIQDKGGDYHHYLFYYHCQVQSLNSLVWEAKAPHWSCIQRRWGTWPRPFMFWSRIRPMINFSGLGTLVLATSTTTRARHQTNTIPDLYQPRKGFQKLSSLCGRRGRGVFLPFYWGIWKDYRNPFSRRFQLIIKVRFFLFGVDSPGNTETSQSGKKRTALR